MMANRRTTGSGHPVRTRAPHERGPLIGTRSRRTFIRACGSHVATSTPHTWPQPTRRQKITISLPGRRHPYRVRGPWRAPLAAGLKQVEDRIHHPPQAGRPRPPARQRRREQRPDQPPLTIRHIACIVPARAHIVAPGGRRPRHPIPRRLMSETTVNQAEGGRSTPFSRFSDRWGDWGPAHHRRGGCSQQDDGTWSAVTATSIEKEQP
jgi:hypothetical protein